MKRFLTAAVLLVVALATISFAQSMSTANEVAPMPVVTSPIVSAITMATPTHTLGATAVNIGPFLPSGTKRFIVAPTTAVAINYGASDVLGGIGYPIIATAAIEKEFFCTPHKAVTLYFIPHATATTPVIRITPFK